jgi:hypothetical protein
MLLIASFYSSIYNSAKYEAIKLMIRLLKCLSLILALSLLVGCASRVNTSTFVEPEIPATFQVYVDKQGLFSIAYPSDWDFMSSIIQESEVFIKNIIESIPNEKGQVIFSGGLPIKYKYEKYSPYMAVTVVPLPANIKTLDQVIKNVFASNYTNVSNYRQYSRTKTTVDGRETAVIEWEGVWPSTNTWSHSLEMVTLIGNNAWVVICTSSPDDFDDWASNFHSVVVSLRILK